MPLWKLLAPEPARSELPVMIVEHRRDGDTSEAFAARVAVLAAEGASAVKIKHYGDAADTTARIAAIRAAVGPALELVVDVGWACTDVESAVALARAWEGHGLAWIEDPFPPEWVDEAVRLRSAVAAPIGIGDGVTSVDLARRLIRSGAVDVLRVDVTTMGGVAGVARLVRAAADAGVRVSPEIFAEVHQHLAAAWPGVLGVEVYSAESRIWAADEFVRPGALRWSQGGGFTLPEAPGSGLALDWDAVARHAVRVVALPLALDGRRLEPRRRLDEQLRVGVRGGAQEPADRALLADDAVLQDERVIAQARDDTEVVGDEEQRETELAPELAEQIEHALPAPRRRAPR